MNHVSVHVVQLCEFSFCLELMKKTAANETNAEDIREM